MYKFGWNCALCTAENETELAWKLVTNGKGFAANCKKCGVGNDIAIELKVKAASESFCFVDDNDSSCLHLQ